MAVDSIAYSLTVGFWSGRRRSRRRRTGEAGFNIKSNNPNLEGGEILIQNGIEETMNKKLPSLDR